MAINAFPARPKSNLITFDFDGFGMGAGESVVAPGSRRYAIAENADLRWGDVGPGLNEVVDRTGIAAGFIVKKMVRHNDVPILLTTNGTDTKVYQQVTTWVLLSTISSRVVTDGVSYNNVLALAFGPSNAYQFSTNTTVNGTAYTFTASTKSTGSAKFANYFCVRSNGLTASRVDYCVNPNLLYSTTDLTDGDATGNTGSTIGDPVVAQDYFTSLFEDDGGTLLIGKRRALFSINSDGAVLKLTKNYDDPPVDSGGGGALLNFQNPAAVEGRVYYVVEAYHLMEYYHGAINEYMAPMEFGRDILRMQLPINAMAAAGGWLVVALGADSLVLSALLTRGGTGQGATGSATLAGTIPIGWSDIWAGRYEGQQWVWHGVLLRTTGSIATPNKCGYLWFDEDDTYLYMASGDAQLANLQQRRAYFTTINPRYHYTGGSLYNSFLGSATVEMGVIRTANPLAWRRAWARTILYKDPNLSGNASVTLKYRTGGDSTWGGGGTTDDSTLVVWTDDTAAQQGCRFPPGVINRDISFKVVVTTVTNQLVALATSVHFEAMPYQRMGAGRR